MSLEVGEHLCVVLVDDLVVEAVHLVDLLRLVVAAVQVELLRVEQLVAQQGEHHLHRPRTPVHEVAVEQVPVALARTPEHVEYSAGRCGGQIPIEQSPFQLSLFSPIVAYVGNNIIMPNLCNLLGGYHATAPHTKAVHVPSQLMYGNMVCLNRLKGLQSY